MLPYPSARTATVIGVFCFRHNAMVRRKQECWTCSWCQHGSEQEVYNAAPPVNCAFERRLTARIRPWSHHPRAA